MLQRNYGGINFTQQVSPQSMKVIEIMYDLLGSENEVRFV